MTQTIDNNCKYHIILATDNGNVEAIFAGDFNANIISLMHKYKFRDIISIEELPVETTKQTERT